MATITENLQAAAAQCAANIAQLELNLATAAAAESTSPKPSYTINEKSVDWNGYKLAMGRLIQEQNEALIRINKSINQINPYIIVTQQTL